MNDYHAKLDARLLALYDEHRALGHSEYASRYSAVARGAFNGESFKDASARLARLLDARTNTPTSGTETILCG